MRFAALRVITVSLLAVCLACSSDTVTPTAPELEDLGTLAAEHHNPGHGGGGGGDGGGGGEQTLYTDFTLSGGYDTAGAVFPVVRQEEKKGILKLGGPSGEVTFSTAFQFDRGSCLVRIGKKDITGSDDAELWKNRLLPYHNFGPLVRGWGMTVDLNNLDVESDSSKFDSPQIGSRYSEGVEPFLTNHGLLTHATFGGVKVTKTTDGDKDIFTFEGGRLGVFDRSGTTVKQNVVIVCRHTTTITVALTRAS